MTAERWSRLRALFHEALGREPADRDAILTRTGAEDAELRDELAALLAAHQTGDGFLEDPSAAMETCEIAPGSHLDGYVLVREIGRGGMGIVFEAVRSDGGIPQTVAIKIVSASPRCAEDLRRFDVERQVLAQLDHPNIAGLLDWDETPAGQPYLVMEYVPEARPLDEFCGTTPVREALRLFLSVCDAVVHAHRHLVVHRDLKPANVLVTKEGHVKLLDFGIAKLLDSGRTTTLLASRRLTPAYASPEQILGEPVTTASDVYPVGVLLCELLTGSLPYRITGTRFEEIAWPVLEQEPRRPSAMEGLSHQRRNLLRGDLDRIVLMALRKEPGRRYSSVEALAGDIRVYLAGGAVPARDENALGVIERGAARAPSSIEFVRERARAHAGLGMWQRSMGEWHALRHRSPLDREGLDEQHAVEAMRR